MIDNLGIFFPTEVCPKFIRFSVNIPP